jgi:hypothetical protein
MTNIGERIMASVPGTDLRSIPDFEAMPAIRDMGAVERAGGQASDVQLGEEDTMNEEELSPEQHAEIMELISQLGGDAALTALREAVVKQGMPEAGPEGPGGPMPGPGGPPMPGGPGPGGPMPGGPQGILSNLQ